MAQPNYMKTIICLANSRKTSGRCIAGREVTNGNIGNWIRPVSSRVSGEVSEIERRFENGTTPQVLDLISVPMIEPKPHSFQSENHLIDSGYYWGLLGKCNWDNAYSSLDAPTHLWNVGTSSSYNGINDRVSESIAAPENGSLRLIEVNDLCINVVLEGAEFNNGKRKVRGRFSYLDTQYYLSVTDPNSERMYLAGENGSFQVGNALLCVSLGDVYNGYTYKLIASIINKAL